MPNERARALRFGREALELIAEDSALDDAVRVRAREILGIYPQQAEVLLWIGADVRLLPDMAVRALSEASELLFRRGVLSQASAETARWIAYAQRHYPERSDCEEWATEQRFRTIREWLLPENYYDSPDAIASHPDFHSTNSTDMWMLRGANELARLKQLDDLEVLAGTRPKPLT